MNQSTSFFPYHFDRRTQPLLRLIGVRADRDGVRLDGEQLLASFGVLNMGTPIANVAEASVTGPYSALKAIGPRLSMADHGLTFGTTGRRGVCLRFDQPISRVVGPWDHPGLTLTVADPERLVAALAERSL